MPLSLLTCLVLAAFVESLVFGAYYSTLEEGDGCCYPGVPSWAGSPPPSVHRRRRSTRRHRRPHRDSTTRNRARGISGGSRRPPEQGTATAAPEATANQGDDGDGSGGSSSSSATLVPSMESESFSHSSSNSNNAGPALRRGHDYNLRQRIMRAQRLRSI
ncbi:hypothetical protein PG989_003530 [Apiospora arundinis]